VGTGEARTPLIDWARQTLADKAEAKMVITYPHDIAPLNRALLEKATQILESTMNKTSSGGPAINTSGSVPTFGGERTNIHVTWNTKKQHGREMYVLTIADSDDDVSVNAAFSFSDLQDRSTPLQLPPRMARLWGDLLEMRSHKYLRQLLTIGND
jgi:hypothetical protein